MSKSDRSKEYMDTEEDAEDALAELDLEEDDDDELDLLGVEGIE